MIVFFRCFSALIRRGLHSILAEKALQLKRVSWNWMMGSRNFTNVFGTALENYVTLNITHEVHTWKLNVGTKNHGPFSNCDWTAALFWCMFWGVSIRQISGVWNVQFSCWSFYIFTTFWGPTKLFPTKNKNIVNRVQESLQRLKWIIPALNVQLGQHTFPIFHVVFLHKGRFEDGWIWKFSQLHGLIHIPSSPTVRWFL